MTRLRSDSSSTCNTTTTTTTTSTTSTTSATEEDSSSVISERNFVRPELHILHNTRRPTIASAIEADTSTDDSTSSSADENNEGVVVQLTRTSVDNSLADYRHYRPSYETDDDLEERQQLSYWNDSRSSLMDEAVHEFGLTSARSITIGREPNYDLRPKFAILKHKTENNSTSAERDQQTGCQDNGSTGRRLPKTPDWFFSIPDSRSPFPTFGSSLAEDSD